MNSSVKIAPSVLSADFCRLGADVQKVLQGGADYIHVDVMDGFFVPNISIGVPVVKSLRKAFPQAFLDVHLMIEKPLRYLPAFAEAGADLLMLHVEADEPQNITASLALLEQLGVKKGLSVKPKTPAECLMPWLERLDMALVMTVEPGFGGQSFMADMMPKVTRLRQLLDGCNPSCELEVDGGVGIKTAGVCVAAGANVLVAGSAVFGAEDAAAAIRAIRESV